MALPGSYGKTGRVISTPAEAERSARIVMDEMFRLVSKFAKARAYKY